MWGLSTHYKSGSRRREVSLTKSEDIFARLAGGQTFTKLDLSNAYQQVELEEQSKQYLVINTHMGLFRYNRSPFGVAAAPAIFQLTRGQPLARDSMHNCLFG